MEIFDVDQGSDQWLRARMGIPTASRFSDILAKGEGKSRRKYLYQLAGEIVSGEPMETFSNQHTERGKVMEDEARDLYTLLHHADPIRVGFIRNGDRGCSPDSLIGESGGLEIKTAIACIQIERLLKDEMPSEHKAQVQGSMWVAERDHWDFVSYWPNLPMLCVRVARDDAYIANLAGEVARFNDELAKTVETIRARGMARAA